MQHTPGVAVLATHIAGTDRRALSEAWYRALHVAEPVARTAASAAPQRHVAAARTLERRTCAPPHHAGGGAAAHRSRGAVTAQEPRTPLGGERRAAQSDLARRIARALVRRTAAVPAAFSFRIEAGRVHVLIRTDGTRTRIVAVCAPALRDTVERALAHARFALAGRGIAREAA